MVQKKHKKLTLLYYELEVSSNSSEVCIGYKNNERVITLATYGEVKKTKKKYIK